MRINTLPLQRQWGSQPVGCCMRSVCRSYIRETAIPKELAQRIAKLETDAYMVSVATAVRSSKVLAYA